MALPSAAEPTIRFATEEDVPTILALIQELADYEHASSSVLATKESLLKTLSFPSNPQAGYAKTLLIFSSSSSSSTPSEPECVGMALYFTNYSTWRGAPGIYLEDLFIQPSFRGKGYGKALLRRLAAETLAIGGRRLEWSCLTWNESALGFYEGWCGAKRMDGWVGLRVEGDEGLGRLAGTGPGERKGEV
ncbi:hypothetical protein MMC25_003193 [Agyrium rufum]|nr:hypothetical protein [Agyrium rufum]